MRGGNGPIGPGLRLYLLELDGFIRPRQRPVVDLDGVAAAAVRELADEK